MKYMININKLFNTKVLMSLAVALTLSLSSCSDFELPEAGSIPDLTPPSAAFGAVTSPDNYLQINFPNLSASATDYIWDFELKISRVQGVEDLTSQIQELCRSTRR